MNIPNFLNCRVVDEKGYFTQEWGQLMTLLLSELNKQAGDEGLFVPSQPAANITILNNSESKNSLIVNSTTNQLLFNKNGTYQVIV